MSLYINVCEYRSALHIFNERYMPHVTIHVHAHVHVHVRVHVSACNGTPVPPASDLFILLLHLHLITADVGPEAQLPQDDTAHPYVPILQAGIKCRDMCYKLAKPACSGSHLKDLCLHLCLHLCLCLCMYTCTKQAQCWVPTRSR